MRRICGVVGSVLLLSGCSLAFVDGPPPGDGPLPRGTCSTSAVAPVLDASGAAMWGLTGGLALADALNDEPDPPNSIFTNESGGVVSLLIAGAYAYSAVRGFQATSECRERQSMSEQAIADYLRSVRLPALGTPDAK
ncbi:hypothetical protein [Candidatus Palauibacter sp.]|uniref:hypothetical protein n=1 Tax=Candidatus Palauibacter sp. TaxID=3101350 RepID=UPI003B5A67DA